MLQNIEEKVGCHVTKKEVYDAIHKKVDENVKEMLIYKVFPDAVAFKSTIGGKSNHVYKNIVLKSNFPFDNAIKLHNVKEVV